jgi:short-subunit dehydrogenase
MQLRGCTALVTGASGGIGYAAALALAAHGVRVRATGLEADGLNELAAACGGGVLVADLSRDEDLRRVVAWAGEVDLLVNNAGYGAYQPFEQIDYEAAAAMLRVNLAAPMHLCAALAPGMVRRGRGHIVNVGSIAGYMGVPREAAYSASKAGLIVYSDSLRAELAGTGVHVTVVLPAAVATGFFAREGHPYERRRPRLVQPGEVAQAIVAAVERDAAEVFVPRWLRFPARLRGAAPGLFRRLAARQLARHMRR